MPIKPLLVGAVPTSGTNAPASVLAPAENATSLNRRPDTILLTADHEVIDGFAGGGFQGLSVCRLDRLDVVASILVVGEDVGD
jgi:hypothetical protein